MELLQCRLQGSEIASEIPIVRMLGPKIPLQKFQDLFNSDPVLHKHASIAATNSKFDNQQKNIFAAMVQQAEKGEVLYDLDLTIEAHGLIIAGSDPTAITLSYSIWAVSSRPTLMRQLQEEVSKLPDDLTEAQVEELPILNAVIEETLRL
jgi:cytochrome P450